MFNGGCVYQRLGVDQLKRSTTQASLQTWKLDDAAQSPRLYQYIWIYLGLKPPTRFDMVDFSPPKKNA